jgi:hypothetical protein
MVYVYVGKNATKRNMTNCSNAFSIMYAPNKSAGKMNKRVIILLICLGDGSDVVKFAYAYSLFRVYAESIVGIPLSFPVMSSIFSIK